MVDPFGRTPPDRRRHTLARGALGCIALAGLLLVGCGGNDPSVTDAAPDATATPGPAAPTPTPILPPGDPTPTPPPPATGTGLPAFTQGSKVTTVGIDAVIFGMTIDEAATAQGTVWEPLEEATGSCYVVRPFNGPDGITLTIADGRVERIDVTTDLITTRSGAGVNSTDTELRDLFGTQLFEEPTGTGTVWQFVPLDDNDQAFRIYFEAENGVVTRYRAGRVPIITPVTPCG
ncbi:MAG: hypothetical protein KDB21_13380 [Acidimicrobiales bacterium]|nr:hypothetical protein [Acidimicrobiales bacterium]